MKISVISSRYSHWLICVFWQFGLVSDSDMIWCMKMCFCKYIIKHVWFGIELIVQTRAAKASIVNTFCLPLKIVCILKKRFRIGFMTLSNFSITISSAVTRRTYNYQWMKRIWTSWLKIRIYAAKMFVQIANK